LDGCEPKLNPLEKVFSAKYIQNLVYSFKEETRGQTEHPVVISHHEIYA
jgi:hypothetical protein